MTMTQHISEADEKVPTRRHVPTNSGSLQHSPDAEIDGHDLEQQDDHKENQEISENQILSAYRSLASRRVDLIGDYAGSELFLIEGDSLLLRCFTDDRLDFANGFQLLHAVYNVEDFLHHLTERRCNFKIVFFDCNRRLCIPEASAEEYEPKYLLARAAIIRHLSVFLNDKHPTVAVKVFESWSSQDFIQYLQDTSPYFLMAHDGAQSRLRPTQDAEIEDRVISTGRARVARRSMILSLISNGYNIALVNELQWQDMKVMTSVLASRHQYSSSQIYTSSIDHKGEKPTTLPFERIGDLGKVKPQLTERQLLAITAISILLLQDQIDALSPDMLRMCYSFLLHQAFLVHIPLANRRIGEFPINEKEKQFLLLVTRSSQTVLEQPLWFQLISKHNASCDIADYIDGRAFFQVCRQTVGSSKQVQDTCTQLIHGVQVLTGFDLAKYKSQYPHRDLPSPRSTSDFDGAEADDGDKSDSSVLPFSNYVFDQYLKSVNVEAVEPGSGQQSRASSKLFAEISHWHNSRKPLVHKGPQKSETSWQVAKAATRNQRFMAEMQKYAASLTNAVGKSLEPETIISGQPKFTPKQTDFERIAPNGEASTVKSASQKGVGAKTSAKNAAKAAMFAQQAAIQVKKVDAIEEKGFKAWITVRQNIETTQDSQIRYLKAQKHMNGSAQKLQDTIKIDCELYMVDCLVKYWHECYQENAQRQPLHIAALIWNHLRNIAQNARLSQSSTNYIESVVKSMNLPILSLPPQADGGRQLSFVSSVPTTKKLEVALPDRLFQLRHCGPYLERSFDSKIDYRVDFHPDAWQVQVLDSIDAHRSVFVVAPTSAGKTFIAFYAMRKILEADDDGILVYVAPTKALVNQIAAEVQARYSKAFKHGKSVWAIHTRDYRINDPSKCQILVTVPHILQIMLLTPSNARTWSSRIKRIIFDEVHLIGQADDGVVWEQLLLMAPCPIIALSATIGDPNEFSKWLGTTQKSIGNELDTIQHKYRYSDLRKYYYAPPQKFSFAGLAHKPAISDLSLDDAPGLEHIHPVATLVDRTRSIPEDLALEPRDCLYLWHAMKQAEDSTYLVPNHLDPKKFLPPTARKQDVLKWEKGLKELLSSWLADKASPFERLIETLGRNFNQGLREPFYSTSVSNDIACRDIDDKDNIIESALPLLCRLHEQDALPAILFNYDRHQCEDICKALLQELTQSEITQVKTGSKWESQLKQWEMFKDQKRQAAAIADKTGKKRSKNNGEVDDADKTSKLAMQQETPLSDASRWERFDPLAPQDGYHFADNTKLQSSELQEYKRQLQGRGIQTWLIEAIERGIGVHHAGMNRKYRQVVEILFRKRFLRVVIATGTLALGINMPCKTVVFSGDSVYLTALNFRQCSGRAGRRGFDLLGNVVFQDVSRPKICQLISSRLPSLIGHFPITTSFVLRLFILLHESKNSDFATTAVKSVLSQSRLYLGGQSFRDQTMHHLRFSIEYLRRQHLLGIDGGPLNFAGLVSHLYYTENSSFAFHALLKEGYFSDLCADVKSNEKRVLDQLMLVMSHIFGRVFCRRADQEFRDQVVKHSSSMVFLPPLPEAASQILLNHNQQTLNVYKTYVKTFIAQHISKDDNFLPFTGVKCGGDDASSHISLLKPAHIRSSYVALSGLGDEFASIHDLCSTVRSGVFLEEAVVPYLPVLSEETAPLNAWLLDFWKHGDVMTLERDNGVRRSDIWFFLNDFSLVLATIVTSLTNFFVSSSTTVDMLDLQGAMDVFEDVKEDEAGSQADNFSEKGNVAEVVAKSFQPAKAKRKEKVVDSWEDEEEDDDPSESENAKLHETAALTEDFASHGIDDEGGLRNVLKAFQILQTQFNEQFREIWA